jgi:hypothetical protein
MASASQKHVILRQSIPSAAARHSLIATTAWAIALSPASLASPEGFGEIRPSGSAPRYFAEFYSYDSSGNSIRGSHTFARFYRVENGRVVDASEISWLPKWGYFGRGYRMPMGGSVPGRNYSVQETLVIARRTGAKVRFHGRFETSPDLFLSAQQQKAKLESGSIRYRLVDNFSYPQATNCIHAVTGVVGYLNTGTKHGQTATKAVVESFLETGKMAPSGQALAPPPTSAPSTQAFRERPRNQSRPTAH